MEFLMGCDHETPRHSGQNSWDSGSYVFLREREDIHQHIKATQRAFHYNTAITIWDNTPHWTPTLTTQNTQHTHKHADLDCIQTDYIHSTTPKLVILIIAHRNPHSILWLFVCIMIKAEIHASCIHWWNSQDSVSLRVYMTLCVSAAQKFIYLNKSI